MMTSYACSSYYLTSLFRLEEIGAAAAKEHTLEKNLEKMKLEWKDLRFEFVQYRDSVSGLECMLSSCFLRKNNAMIE